MASLTVGSLAAAAPVRAALGGAPAIEPAGRRLGRANGRGHGSYRLPLAEPVRPGAAAQDVPQVGLAGITLLDPDERQVAAQRGVVRRLEVEPETRELGKERWRVAMRLRRRIAVVDPEGDPSRVQRVQGLERVDE